MAKDYMRAQDTIAGKQGKATVNINGNVQELFFIKSVEATLEKAKTEIKTVGKLATQHKSVGWGGSGTLTIYYVSSLFRSLIKEYVKTGRDTYFTLTVVNEDPASSVGKQTTVLYNCNIDSVMLAKIDVDSDALDEDVPFTFDDFDILDEFSQPTLA